jgi:hypothetical protein
VIGDAIKPYYSVNQTEVRAENTYVVDVVQKSILISALKH